MVKNHLKTLAAPRTWPINRRLRKFITRPDPGPHKLRFGLPLNYILRDILRYSDTSKEGRKILLNKEIQIDGIVRKNFRFIVGLFDTIRIEKSKKYFRLLLNKKGKLDLIEIEEEESKFKPCKIIGKQILKKGTTQINLYDGKNQILDKDDYNVGDTVIVNLPDSKIKKHLKLEKGAVVFFTGGKHIGYTGEVEDIRKDKIIYKSDDGDSVETLKKHAFVIGTGKSEITIK